jgi:hypothetical protein
MGTEVSVIEHRVKLIGGTFSDGAGAPSAYFDSLADAIERRAGHCALIAQRCNGGSLADLETLVETELADPSCAVLWMARALVSSSATSKTSWRRGRRTARCWFWTQGG